MITVITICYVGCVFLAFKVIKIKVAPISVAVAALVGVFILGGVVIGWKMSAPMSGQMTVKRDVIQLLSGQDSKERIKEVHVEQDQMVQRGDVLYEVDPQPSQYAVDQLAAQLAASQAKISELQAALEVASATVAKAQADEAYAKANYDTTLKARELNPKSISELRAIVDQENYVAAQAAVEEALASEREAQFALTSAKEGIKATEAQLSTAKFNLDQCVIRAPADGYIMNWQAMEGTMSTTVITSAQGTFMDMTETVVGAVFPQNLLVNVQAGDTVEIAFKSLPGEVAAGKVDAVLEYTGEGQLTPEAVLPVAANLGSKGFLVVRISLDDEKFAKNLPLGGAGTVAIYTKVGQPFHLISKISLRIKAWMYYVPI